VVGDASGSINTDNCKQSEKSIPKVSFGDEKVVKTLMTCENGDWQVYYGEITKNKIGYAESGIQNGDDTALAIFDQIISSFKITPVVESNQAKQVVIQFMDYYVYKTDAIKKNADLEKMFALFTPPANSDEQNALDFLLEKDTGVTDVEFRTRIYDTATYGAQVKSYEIGEGQNQGDYYLFPITIRTYLPAGTGGNSKELYGTKKAWFRSIRSDSGWKVDQFYSDSWTDSRDVIPNKIEGVNTQVKKYSGFS